MFKINEVLQIKIIFLFLVIFLQIPFIANSESIRRLETIASLSTEDLIKTRKNFEMDNHSQLYNPDTRGYDISSTNLKAISDIDAELQKRGVDPNTYLDNFPVRKKIGDTTYL